MRMGTAVVGLMRIVPEARCPMRSLMVWVTAPEIYQIYGAECLGTA